MSPLKKGTSAAEGFLKKIKVSLSIRYNAISIHYRVF